MHRIATTGIVTATDQTVRRSSQPIVGQDTPRTSAINQAGNLNPTNDTNTGSTS